ncbi:MAG: nitric oxide reductase [Maribacter sp.]|nr:nitric oxide reductase [Maribacter sp.]
MNEKFIDHKSIYYPPGGILIWIIIFLELITFGIALVVMVNYGKQEPEIFHNSRLQLSATIGTINTLFLITSGYFMARSVNYLKNDDKDRSAFFLKFTMLGGLLFLVLKCVEYYFKIEAGLTVGYNTFYTFYWMLTLFHVIHVIVGLVILVTVFFGLRKKIPTVSLEDMEASAAFWHMCDLIWLLLFPVIYLLF